MNLIYGLVRIALITRHPRQVMLSKSVKITNAMDHVEMLIMEIELGSSLGM